MTRRVGLPDQRNSTVLRVHIAVSPSHGDTFGSLRSHRDRLGARVDPSQSLVRPLDVPDDALAHPPRAAAVLMDLAARVGAGRQYVGRLATGREPDDLGPSALLGPHLRPVDDLAVERDAGEAAGRLHHEVGSDGSGPGPTGAAYDVGHVLRLGHSRRSQEVTQTTCLRQSGIGGWWHEPS